MRPAPARRLAGLAALAVAALLSACAGPAPIVAEPASLFADAKFGPPTEPISTDGVLAVSDAMRRYLDHDIADQLRTKGMQVGLIDALYRRGQLKLEYDAAQTRTAAEAFDARSGNCLSLLLMTAAFANELKLPVRFQSAYLDETWSRDGNLLFASGHVNIVVGRRFVDANTSRDLAPLQIDFLPPEDLRRLRTREIGEKTVLAMYANNRAAEAMAKGRLDDAYAWAREALRRDSSFAAAFNTLGVVYLRHGDPVEAERVFESVLARDRFDNRALANLAETYRRQGRAGDAEAMQLRLAEVEAHPPFHFFQLGLDAARANDWRTARGHFAREVERADYYHEFHYWLGLADFQLGDLRQAQKHLQLARDQSTTRGQADLYSAKLAWLQARRRE